MTVVPQD